MLQSRIFEKLLVPQLLKKFPQITEPKVQYHIYKRQTLAHYSYLKRTNHVPLNFDTMQCYKEPTTFWTHMLPLSSKAMTWLRWLVASLSLRRLKCNSRPSPYGIFSGQSGTRTDFSPNTSVSRQLHFTIIPHGITHLSPMLRNISDQQFNYTEYAHVQIFKRWEQHAPLKCQFAPIRSCSIII
jgi:hypothetical protein